MVKNLPVNVGDVGSIPRSGRSPGVENGNPFQFSCLENSMDRGAWWATVHGIPKSQTRLSTHTILIIFRKHKPHLGHRLSAVRKDVCTAMMQEMCV